MLLGEYNVGPGKNLSNIKNSKHKLTIQHRTQNISKTTWRMGVSPEICYIWLSTSVSVHRMSSWYHSKLPWRSPWLGPRRSQQSPGVHEGREGGKVVQSVSQQRSQGGLLQQQRPRPVPGEQECRLDYDCWVRARLTLFVHSGHKNDPFAFAKPQASLRCCAYCG